jgi:hypothetical protein
MSIQTVEIALPTGIDSVSVGMAEPISIVEVRQGPAGPAGSAVINAATTSDGTAALYLDSIRFEATNGGPTQLGEMAWESNDGSIDAMLESGVIVAMGEDLVIRVRNTTASPITKGTALAYDGTSGASGRIEVKPWVGANIPTAKLFLGFAACDMPANSNGYSQWFGKLTEINTSGGGQTWLDEQIIYAVPGASATITNVAPTSGEYAAAAVVINAGSGTSGILFVRPTFEVASSTSATANTLVLRDGSGGASFAGVTLSGINTNSGSYSQVGGANFNVATTTAANLTATGSGTVTVSGEGGTTISGGPLTISASSATFATGSIATSQPLALTQTWTNAATTYTGLQVNVTDTASAAASLLMDLRVGGSSKMEVSKSGNIRVKSTSADGGPLGHAMGFDIGGSVWGFSNGGANSFRFGTLNNAYLYVTSAKQWRFAGTTNIGWSPGTPDGAADLLLVRDGASGTLAQRNGNAAQESRIYGTYANSGADYRRLALKMSTAGVAQIVAEGAGTGAADNRLEFVTGGATRMTVAADGNITASGTMSPAVVDASNFVRANLQIILENGGAWRVNLNGTKLGATKTCAWTNNTSNDTIDTALSRGNPGQVLIGTGATGSFAGSLKLTDLEAVGTIKTGGYTFDTLPTPTAGMRAYITDGAASPVYMANAAGGGSTVTPVFYNGTNWINA